MNYRGRKTPYEQLNFRTTREYGQADGFTPPLVNPGETSKSMSGGIVSNFTGQAYSQAPPPMGFYDGLKYGDIQQVALNVGLVDQLVLSQPDVMRTFLLVTNIDPVSTIFIAFGSAASALVGLPLAPANTVFFDSWVPQNDVHIIGNAASVLALLMYSNKAI